MGWLVRKFQQSKWNSVDWAGPNRIPADAISIDLKTISNSLSFWFAESSSDDHVLQSVAAIAAGLERIETIDVVVVADDGLELAATDGRTAFDERKSLHRDVVDIDHHSLALVAERIGAEIYADKTRRFTKSELRRLLRPFFQQGKLGAGLSEAVREELMRPDPEDPKKQPA